VSVRRVGATSFTAYALAFAVLVVSGIVLVYGVLGSSHAMVWTSVALSAAAVVGTAVSLLTGKRVDG
jgi:hypothetical protein